MKKKHIFPFILLVAVACNKKKEEFIPQLRNITESVYASVNVSPQESYFVFSNKTGIIDRIYVSEDDSVDFNQLLFKIRTVEVDNQMENAKLDVQQAQSDLKGEESLLQSLTLDLELAKQQLALDSVNFYRQERLWKQNIGSKIQYDNAKLSYEKAANNYSALKKRYAQTKIDLANNYKKALNRLDQQESTLKDYTIEAQLKGKVYQLFKEEGELIHPQEAFGEIGSTNSFKVEMDIDEVDITRIEIGDTSIIKLDAYPNEVFKSVIDKIYPKKDETTLTFKVESKFIEQPPKLYNGLAGEANIIIGVRKKALTIPTEYLSTNNTVFTSDGEKKVEIGLRNLEFVEILSGIDSNTVLIKPKP